jgi:predicted DNA-binding protein YlxM (UPF0122 family)
LQAPTKTFILVVRYSLTAREDWRMLTMTQIDDIRNAFFFKGLSISEIAREFKVDRKTVRKYVYQEDWNTSVEVKARRSFTKLEPFKEDIDEWLEEDKKRAGNRGIQPSGSMIGYVKNMGISLTALIVL